MVHDNRCTAYREIVQNRNIKQVSVYCKVPTCDESLHLFGPKCAMRVTVPWTYVNNRHTCNFKCNFRVATTRIRPPFKFYRSRRTESSLLTKDGHGMALALWPFR